MGRPLVIAVDFDGTIVSHEFPKIGKPNKRIIGWLITQKKNGEKLILWTCRANKELEEAVLWCKNNGIEFDAVNEDVDSVKNSDFGKNKSCKVCADMYLDDRNLSMLIFKGD